MNWLDDEIVDCVLKPKNAESNIDHSLDDADNRKKILLVKRLVLSINVSNFRRWNLYDKNWQVKHDCTLMSVKL